MCVSVSSQAVSDSAVAHLPPTPKLNHPPPCPAPCFYWLTYWSYYENGCGEAAMQLFNGPKGSFTHTPIQSARSSSNAKASFKIFRLDLDFVTQMCCTRFSVLILFWSKIKEFHSCNMTFVYMNAYVHKYAFIHANIKVLMHKLNKFTICNILLI